MAGGRIQKYRKKVVWTKILGSLALSIERKIENYGRVFKRPAYNYSKVIPSPINKVEEVWRKFWENESHTSIIGKGSYLVRKEVLSGVFVMQCLAR